MEGKRTLNIHLESQLTRLNRNKKEENGNMVVETLLRTRQGCYSKRKVCVFMLGSFRNKAYAANLASHLQFSRGRYVCTIHNIWIWPLTYSQKPSKFHPNRQTNHMDN